MASTLLAALFLIGMPVLSIPIKTPQCADYCMGTSGNDTRYVCGDYRLGPVDLPAMVPLNISVYGYDRFDGQCPGAFLATWWNTSLYNNYGGWIYPPFDGFLLQDDGTPLSGNVTLPIGTKLDRFGGEGGNFTAPYGSPYEQRSIPPSNLDTRDGMFPYEYYVYEVREPFQAIAGPIRPWFGQAGQGTQYETYSSLSVLVAKGLLRRVSQIELLSPALGP